MICIKKEKSKKFILFILEKSVVENRPFNRDDKSINRTNYHE